MARASHRLARDRGESLVELTMAISILGIVVVAIGTSIAFTVMASGLHRKQAVADQYLHNYAEALQSTYAPCAGTPAATATSYIQGLVTSPIGAPGSFAAPTASIVFWDSAHAGFSPPSATCPASDPGLQQVTLNLTSTDGGVRESLVVVIRRTT